MNLVDSLRLMDFRKDELMHIGRYFNACSTIINLADKLGRPLRVLDLGCGEAYTMRTFYKSFVVKKSDIVKQYIGVDIDRPMLKRTTEKYKKVFEAVNGKLIPQDLTVEPALKLKDNSVDVVFWFEMAEHIQPEFIPQIFEEVYRCLSSTGLMLFSTPNSNGSNKTLPKDHVYEWSYEKMKKCIVDAHYKIISEHGTCINPSRIPKDLWKKERKLLKQFMKLLAKIQLLAVLRWPHYFLFSIVKICYLY